ncbi:MAG: DUF4058 family protein [Gemmataceae bacterium]|nr:DUF4058 family protein [Gemmataceae bacterium]
MKSPFPGMDPYIEARGLWEDFHHHLIEQVFQALAASVPEHYMVRTGERAYVVLAEPEGKEENLFKPDVGVTSPKGQQVAAEKAAETAVTEPEANGEAVSLRAFIAEEYRETFIDIYAEDPEQHLVTCIEILSPSNKRPGTEGWQQYLRKRQGLLLGAANLVEIDLLRGGRRMPMLDPWPNSPYYLLVARRERAPRCKVWRAHFQRRLPILHVPLAQPDPDVALDLQPMIESIYDRARYGRSIDYAKPLTPPLTAEESAWLAEQLRARQA